MHGDELGFDSHVDGVEDRSVHEMRDRTEQFAAQTRFSAWSRATYAAAWERRSMPSLDSRLET